MDSIRTVSSSDGLFSFISVLRDWPRYVEPMFKDSGGTSLCMTH